MNVRWTDCFSLSIEGQWFGVGEMETVSVLARSGMLLNLIKLIRFELALGSAVVFISLFWPMQIWHYILYPHYNCITWLFVAGIQI